MTITFNQIQKHVKTYFLISFGLFIFASGWTLFIIPAKIVGSGLTGIGLLIYYATGFPVGISTLLGNAVLVAIASKFLGTKFGINTIFGILFSSLLFILMQGIVTEPIIKDQFMSALLGAIMGGAGVGIAISSGGNSGGTDIIALLVNKYYNISPGRVILICDVIIIGSSYLIFQSLEKLVFGYVVMAVGAYTIDLMLDGAKQSYQITIFSQQSQKIADRLGTEVGCGVTFLKGQGWYTKEEIDVVMVIARKHSKRDVLRIIKETDNHAFVSVAKVMGVFGRNFDRLRY